MPILEGIKNRVYKKTARFLRHLIDYDKSYQSFLYNGKYIEGQVDTVRMYYSLGLASRLKNKSWLDLGCNEGSICLMAAQDGAAPVTGVDMERDYLARARKHALQANKPITFVHENIVDFIKHADNRDIVSLFALARHVYRHFLKAKGIPLPKTGRAGMIYDSFEKIILGENSPVKAEFDAFMATCISKANEFFVVSINDHSGQILRYAPETKAYFQSLSPRVSDTEIFCFSPQNPEYVVVKMHLSPR